LELTGILIVFMYPEDIPFFLLHPECIFPTWLHEWKDSMEDRHMKSKTGFQVRSAVPDQANSLRSGLVTVEYSILMPLLIFLVILLMFVVFTLHDIAVLHSVTIDTAESLARVWRCGENPQKWMDSGDWSPEARDARTLYWQLDTAITGEKVKADRVAALVAQRLQNRRWLPRTRLNGTAGEDVLVVVSCQGGIPFSTLRVETTLAASVPASRLMARFGMDGVLRFRATADALVTDPKSLITDLDWGLQMLQETGAGKLYGKIADPVRTWYAKAVSATNGNTGAK
jgi:hypothetical protein